MTDPSGALRRPFGSEVRAFVLTIGAWRELEKARNAGIGVIATRIAPMVRLLDHPGGVATYPGGLLGAVAHGLLGSFYVDDIRDTLLWGLVGGGMPSTDAGILVRKVFEEGVDHGNALSPVMRWAPLAFKILTGALIGLEDEPIEMPGEPVAAAPAKPRRRSKTASRDSQTSTAPQAG